MNSPQLEFREVDESNWDDLSLLFEERGGPKYCWCMAWRKKPNMAGLKDSKSRNAALKTALHSRVEEGVPIGILAYIDGRPVAWCSIAPRQTYRPLGGPKDFEEGSEAVWSLVCFFIKRAFRGQGMSVQILEAAIEYARRSGAKIVEAYPVDPDSPSYRFMGLTSFYENAGFIEVGRAGTRRHVVRLSLV